MALPFSWQGSTANSGCESMGGHWHSCRTAVIPAGVVHELDLCGYPLAVFYVEPKHGGIEVLVSLSGNIWEVDGVVMGRSGEVSVMRELWEDSAAARWAGLALEDLLAFSARRATKKQRHANSGGY
ncbi:hypothetical protein Q1M64_03260 (plasmid) [Sinorhizobium meliloti]|nr:hypothetical protein Q1M64_03260 [Sinorhizobium meliloti]